ncbi:hypothetical protein AYM02_02820 [Coxiella burnetii]|uniref:outer membrane beta-barrel protein n=1 Tax=Coxiella burnetii TaxID=777 RepID=UPI00031F46CC|nr:outer membrane beta-barrel protein [Coxiella burnetii]AML48291.1 hypothetical protein AUR58_03175 [Coxiella burnetii]AML54304.1 hypothetical protein AYM38_02790 [Coxiella burnetii]ATN68269.1 hypothetical protein AYM00_02900 [Coxiella burnetii]ATN70196.1 hypothetical protein AYM02_02820 [Coxiella burnetii]ATN72141.1 hypothetical protein AYM11_02730 [Coxiella burnetii]
MGRCILYLFCLLSALFLIPTNAAAGGIEVPHYIPIPFVYSGVYVEGLYGYASRDWESYLPYQTYVAALQGDGPPFGPFVKRGKGGSVAGVDVGYQWNRYFAAEIGWIHLPTVRYLVPSGLPVADGRISEHSWLGYIALKLAFPICGNLYAYSKVGAAGLNIRTRINFTPVNDLTQNGDFWSPLFAVGLQYYLNWYWFFTLQYLHVNGYGRASSGAIQKLPSPHSDLFTFSVGYKLAI